MGYLIDTCAIAELGRPCPSPEVASWFRTAAPESLFVSVLTLGELCRGAERLNGRRRRDIARWMETTLAAWFGDRLLPVDAAVVLEWGRLTGCLCRQMPAMDDHDVEIQCMDSDGAKRPTHNLLVSAVSDVASLSYQAQIASCRLYRHCSSTDRNRQEKGKR